MAKFTKQILGSRTYYPPDKPDGLEVTPERIKHWADTFGKFKEAGLDVPIGWNHPDDPDKCQPTPKSDRRKKRPEIVGYLDGFNLSDDGDSAEIVLDVRKKEEDVRKNLKRVSPIIFDKWEWTDGDGTVWDDCITRIDLVDHPVDHRQTDFTEVTACALRMGLDTGNPTIYRLQKDPEMAEEETTTTEETTEVTETTVSDDSGRMKKVLEALAKMDIVLSDDTNEENFLEHLEQALLTADAQNGGGENAGEGDLEVASPEFAALSLERQKERKYLNNQLRKTTTDRLTALVTSGRCTPAEAKDRTPAVNVVSLSLDDDGNAIPSAVEEWISSREAVPQGTFWSEEQRTRMSQLEVEPQPEGLDDGQLTHEQADKVADEVLKFKR